MKRLPRVLATLAVAATALFIANTINAAEKAKPVTIQGIVSVWFNEEDETKVDAITITTADGAEYMVTLDKNGMALRAMDGKRVEVAGSMVAKTEIEGEEPTLWVSVQTARELPRVAEANDVEDETIDDGGDDAGEGGDDML